MSSPKTRSSSANKMFTGPPPYIEATVFCLFTFMIVNDLGEKRVKNLYSPQNFTVFSPSMPKVGIV
ncbi:hypothetical protein ADA01nite_09920 [Aneurinibacillus danicus]|uniref:Uncharacterized protein n=1 Tax=Aneurinibacillus danicus TaxID=267746 RepID=A0A511V8J3_9BACL|nr:hypothetical protein ADA01nite_09920 [Aneurinibacillus danicus]